MDNGSVFAARNDGRLVTLLRGGDDILSAIDPEGVLSMGVVRKIVLRSDGKDSRYHFCLFINFQGGDCICVSCLRTDEGVVVRSLSIKVQGKGWESVGVMPDKSVLRSLGDPSRISVHIRRNLASVSPEVGKDEALDSSAPLGVVDTFRRYLLDSLFWQVEGAGEDSRARNYFKEVSVKFSRGADGFCVKDSVVAEAELKEGRITLSMELDLFGLSDKKVMLCRNLGLGRSFEAECFSMRDGNRLPSLRVALDLNKHVPVFYASQRGKKISMGSPKGFRK